MQLPELATTTATSHHSPPLPARRIRTTSPAFRRFMGVLPSSFPCDRCQRGGLPRPGRRPGYFRRIHAARPRPLSLAVQWMVPTCRHIIAQKHEIHPRLRAHTIKFGRDLIACPRCTSWCATGTGRSWFNSPSSPVSRTRPVRPRGLMRPTTTASNDATGTGRIQKAPRPCIEMYSGGI